MDGKDFAIQKEAPHLQKKKKAFGDCKQML
jgi:hypothetical protein